MKDGKDQTDRLQGNHRFKSTFWSYDDKSFLLVPELYIPSHSPISLYCIHHHFISFGICQFIGYLLGFNIRRRLGLI
jgi:hypothetical protein